MGLDGTARPGSEGDRLPWNPSYWISNRFIHAMARWIARRRLELEVEGLEHLPRRGPLVIAARHYHHAFDGAALFTASPRPLSLVVTLDWVTSRAGRFCMERLARLARFPVLLREEALLPGPDGRVLHPDSAYAPEEVFTYGRSCMRDAATLVAGGGALLVFPEAYPNVDPHHTPKEGARFMAFRGGFVSIAEIAARRLGAPVPIVPAGLVYEPGPRWRATLRFGEALRAPGPHGSRALVAAVQERVMDLSRAAEPAALSLGTA